jgi:sugar transferase (PEP-CTERM/EpsH1 system associated)
VKASRPRLLCLIHRVPYPPNRGDRIRSFHLLKFLADRAEVHLAFPSQGRPHPETIKALERYCQRVSAVPVGRRMRWVSAAWSLGVGRTGTEGLFRSARLKRIVSAWARENHFDAVVVVCSSMVQYLDATGLDGLPVIVDLVDVDSQKWFQYAQHSWGLKRRIFQLEGRRLRRLEASLPDRVDALAFVSSHEAELFRSFCPTDRLHVIGNGVDLDYFRPDAASGTSTSPDCVFVGALDYQANLDGVTWFCREIWPEVRRRHPQAAFRLVGSSPGRAARRLARTPGVDLVGQVPDVRPYLRAAAIAVVPLRVARGLQNKVLEAMAVGKAVVATPQALEGIGATPGVHLCQAVTPAQWVQTIISLLSDPHLGSRLGGAAREFVNQGFQWNAQLQPLIEVPGLRGCFQELSPRTRQQIVV